MAQNLPIARLIDVDVNLTPGAAQAQDLSTLLVLGNSNVIDVTERIRTYTSIASVAADFGTSAPEYFAALAYFGQAPQPDQIMIGRWAKTATAGKLVCAPLSAENQLIATWQAITTGSLRVDVDGGGNQDLTGLDFSGQTNLNGVASVINGALAGLTCSYNSEYDRFEFQSNTTGDGSTVSFLSSVGSGNDISDNLGGRSSDSGAYVADGIDAESAVDAATLFDQRFGQTWYALFMPEIDDNNDHIAVAQYIEASLNKHLYGVNTQEGGVLSTVSTTDIAYLLSELELTRSIVQYSSSSEYAVASLLGRALSVDFDGNSTVITLMYKQEPGIDAETLTETQINALEDKNANVFVEYNNNTSIIEPGKTSSGNFIDEMTGIDWLAVTIMTAIYNLLYTSPTKIPQTDAGSNLIVASIEAVCSQGVVNGLLAPGVWNSAGFGTLTQGDFLPKGFYVYAPPVATQSQAAREARQSVVFQIAAKLAGAVHTVETIITVNR